VHLGDFAVKQSCPYGQTAGGGRCKTSDGTQDVVHPVAPQLVARRPADAVFCTCRCGGFDSGAEYCECPQGYACKPLISSNPLNAPEIEEISGSYCMPEEDIHPDEIPSEECNAATHSRG
jgi:hypothetical protein